MKRILFCFLAFLCVGTSISGGPMQQIFLGIKTNSIDPDAQAYFDEVVINGGTIGDTAKAAINTFVVGCKADGIWSLLVDIGPLCGDDLPAALTKLKWLSGANSFYVNTNFVSGDYSQATGLTGNGSSKRLAVGFLASDLTTNSTGLGVYVSSSANATANGHGARVTGGTQSFFFYHTYSDDVPYSDQYADATQIGGTTVTGPIGMIFGTVPSSGSHVLYRNGSSVGSSGTVSGSLPGREITFFALNDTAGFFEYTAHTLGGLFITLGMDATQAAAFYARWQALMTAFGRNV